MNGLEHGEWRRSSFCADNACVEVKELGDDIVVRNGRRPHIQLHVSRAVWVDFVEAVARHEFG